MSKMKQYFSSVLLIFTVAQVLVTAQNDGELCTLGGPLADLNHQILGNWMNVFMTLAFPCAGQVSTWKYYGRHTGTFYAAVWRPFLSNNRFVLIGWNQIKATDVGVQSATIPPSERIYVEAGDVIGLFYDHTQTQGVLTIENYHDAPSPCCNFTATSMSDTYNAGMYAIQLNLGAEVTGPGHALRLPALKAVVEEANIVFKVDVFALEGTAASCPCLPSSTVIWSWGLQEIARYDVTADPPIKTAYPRLQVNITSGSLMISNVELGDEALLSCQAQNSGVTFASMQTRKCNIIVEVPPQDISLTGGEGPLPEKSSVVFTCRVGRVKPNVDRIEWLLGDKQIDTAGNREMSSARQSGGTFSVVSKLQLTIRRNYNNTRLTCLIVTRDTVFMKGVNLNVREDFQEFSALRGTEFTLPCHPKSREIESVTWFRGIAGGDGSRVVTFKRGSRGLDPPVVFPPYDEESISLDVRTGDLSWPSVNITDEEWYRCQATGFHPVYRRLIVNALPSSITVKQLDSAGSTNVTLSCYISEVRPEVSQLLWLHNNIVIKSEPRAQLNSQDNGDGTVNQWSNFVVPTELSSDLTGIACSVHVADIVLRQNYESEPRAVAVASFAEGVVIPLGVLLSLAVLVLLIIGILFCLHWRKRRQEPKRMSVLDYQRNRPPSRVELSCRAESSFRSESDPRYTSDPTDRTTMDHPILTPRQISNGLLRPLPTLPMEEPTYLELQASVDDIVSPGPDPLAGIRSMSSMDEYLDMSRVPDSEKTCTSTPKYLNYNQSNGGSRPSSDLDVEVKARHYSFKSPASSSVSTYLPMTGTLEKGNRSSGLDVEVGAKGQTVFTAADKRGPDYLNIHGNDTGKQGKALPPYMDMSGSLGPNDDMDILIEAPMSPYSIKNLAKGCLFPEGSSARQKQETGDTLAETQSNASDISVFDPEVASGDTDKNPPETPPYAVVKKLGGYPDSISLIDNTDIVLDLTSQDSVNPNEKDPKTSPQNLQNKKPLSGETPRGENMLSDGKETPSKKENKNVAEQNGSSVRKGMLEDSRMKRQDKVDEDDIDAMDQYIPNSVSFVSDDIPMDTSTSVSQAESTGLKSDCVLEASKDDPMDTAIPFPSKCYSTSDTHVQIPPNLTETDANLNCYVPPPDGANYRDNVAGINNSISSHPGGEYIELLQPKDKGGAKEPTVSKSWSEEYNHKSDQIDEIGQLKKTRHLDANQNINKDRFDNKDTKDKQAESEA